MAKKVTEIAAINDAFFIDYYFFGFFHMTLNARTKSINKTMAKKPGVAYPASERMPVITAESPIKRIAAPTVKRILFV